MCACPTGASMGAALGTLPTSLLPQAERPIFPEAAIWVQLCKLEKLSGFLKFLSF